jgi:hypothetical protein
MRDFDGCDCNTWVVEEVMLSWNEMAAKYSKKSRWRLPERSPTEEILDGEILS